MGTNGKTLSMFDEPMSGAEVIRRVDAAILKVRETLDGLLAIRSGIHDLEGLDAQAKPVEPVKRLLLYFDHRHKQTFKDPATDEPIAAVIAWGKDNAIMKRIRDTHGDERTESLIDDFFAQRTEYCERMGYTVQTFASRVAGLIAQRGRPAQMMGVSRATQSNARNSAVAVDMIQKTYGAR